MPAGKPKGYPKTGGRQPGTPNKATADVRATIAMFADDMAGEFKKWVQQTADGLPEEGVKPDPGKAAALYLTAIEYHIPKLARTEVSGNLTVKTLAQELSSLNNGTE
ncbi:MAG: hypothetical protein KGL39_16790 [Patescibacteria group bacterium]|nr:hypothetical protein [Patescibacteria group bacterium]